MAEWELSKENIQPLKHGRKMATLNSILQVSSEEFNSARYLSFTISRRRITYPRVCPSERFLDPPLLSILYIGLTGSVLT